MTADIRHANVDRSQTGAAVLPLAVCDPAVVLDRPHSHHEHYGAWPQTAEPADDVEELLHPHVRAESGFGHHVFAELHPDQVSHEGVVSVVDVGERAAMHQARLSLERLD